jgi:hypothetical protein
VLKIESERERERAKERNGESQFIGMFSIVDVYLMVRTFQIATAVLKKKSRLKKLFFRKSAITLTKYNILKKPDKT